MNDPICVDKKYSTTRLLIQADPVIFLPKAEGRKGEGGLRTKSYLKKSYDDKPLISIITVVFNGEKYLEGTIQSVINQTYDNVEYIIIDGGSTDGTVDIIKRYEGKIDYWISGKDSGIYDAMNKGVLETTGDIIGIINSDDYYENSIFTQVIKSYQENGKPDIMYGNLVLIDEVKEKKRISIPSEYKLNRKMSLNHPTCFVKKTLYNEKLFNISYKICADYDLILHLKKVKKSFLYINKTISYMRIGGISSTSYKTTTKEVFNIQIRYFGYLLALKNINNQYARTILKFLFMRQFNYILNKKR